MKTVTIEDIKKRICQKWPNQSFEIIEYTRVTKRFVLKCCKCGRIKTYSSFSNFITPKRFSICPCYNENHSDTKHENNLILAEIATQEKGNSFIKFDYNVKTKKYLISIKCRKCNQVFTKPITEYLKNSDCYYCETKQMLNTEGFKSILAKEYELIGEYKDSETPVLLRHNCGFIWKIAPKRLNNYVGCPKCNIKMSKGANKIKQWLEGKFQFEIEKKFAWQSNQLRRYDFYIPEYNTIIEFHGEQHYCENHFFKTPVLEQQKIDDSKRAEALKNNVNYIEIGFFEIDSISEILNNWFNDYPVTEVGVSAPKWRASIYNG